MKSKLFSASLGGLIADEQGEGGMMDFTKIPSFFTFLEKHTRPFVTTLKNCVFWGPRKGCKDREALPQRHALLSTSKIPN